MDGIYSLPGFHHPLSSMSHFAGAVVLGWLAYYLLQPLWGRWGQFASVLIFVFSAVGLLSVSGTYHMFVPGSLPREIMLRIDHVAIFLLIAGTFTPLHTLMFRGWRRWGVLGLVWSIAIIGSVLRVIFLKEFSTLANAGVYLGMGWIGGVTAWLIWQSGKRELVLPVILGGVCYSLGAVSDALGWPTFIPGIWGPHESLHFAVLAGLAFHWSVIAKMIENYLNEESLSDQARPPFRGLAPRLPGKAA